MGITAAHQVIFRIWSNDPAILSSCASTLFVFALCLVVAFLRFLLTASLNALGKAQLNLVANNVASWLVYVPLSYVLPLLWHWGLPGFWWADLAGESVKLLILTLGLVRVRWVDVATQASLDAAEVHDEEQAALCALEQQVMVTPERGFHRMTPTLRSTSMRVKNDDLTPRGFLTRDQRRDSLPWS